MRFAATRLPQNPIITPDTPGYDADGLGTNINGPSLIRVPDWLPGALGKYYLYFAHHQGKSIRLAYANDVAGPWTVHTPGTLQLEQTPFTHHLASPDVHLDEPNRRLIMYYHGCRSDTMPMAPGDTQASCVAFSSDGLAWESNAESLGSPYFRVFRLGEWTYAVAAGGKLFRSADGVTGFEQRWGCLDHSGRHWALLRRGDTLHCFYSRWGDAPEHLVHATLPLEEDWKRWRLDQRWPLLTAKHDWEGADQPVRISIPGSVHEPVHELRDPCVYEEAGHTYLLYSVAGESGIAIAELTDV